MGGSIAWSRIRHGQVMEIGEEDATETPFIGQKGRSSAKSDPEETMHKMIRGKSSIESNVFDPPRTGEIRKPDIMDKYNEYAGKEGSRSVDARIVRRSTKPVAEFPRCA